MTEVKPKFWHTPIGKKMSYLAHESVNASALMAYEIVLIEKQLPELRDEEIDKRLNSIRKQIKRITEAVDYTYEEIKKIQGYE